jgi:segregation and condensation protein B
MFGGESLVAQDTKLAEIEALLYAAGRPMSLTSIVAMLKLEDELEASRLVDKLSETYEADPTALEIKRLPQEKVVLQLKSDYTKPASKYSMKPLLTAGPLGRCPISRTISRWSRRRWRRPGAARLTST